MSILLDGFFASFFSFAIQFFLIKISQFLFNENQLTVLYSIFVFGLCMGAMSFYKLRRHGPQPFLYFSIFCILLLISFKIIVSPIIFYALVLILMAPLGYILASGFSAVSSHRFYFFDLMGGVVGLIYGLLSISFLSIESSLLLFSMAALFLSSRVLKKKTTYLIKAPLFILLTGLLFLQIKYDGFNLIKLAVSIEDPPVPQGDINRNGKFILNSERGQLIATRWSVFDRVDIIEVQNSGLIAFANNTSWTEIATQFSEDNYPYLERRKTDKVLSLGMGGGDDFVTAKRLKAKTIIGIEINAQLVSLLKNELSVYNKELFNGVHLLVEDGRFYLKSSTDKFDLIFNKSTDTRSKSTRYLTHYNLLRTQEAMREIINHLDGDGFAIWTIHLDNGYLAPTLFDIIFSAGQILIKNGVRDLNQHFLVFGETSSLDWINKTGNYHIVFSNQPVTREILEENFVSNKKFKMVYPSSVSRDYINTLFAGLYNFSSESEVLNYLNKFNKESISLLSDANPVEKNYASAKFILLNIAICILLLISFTCMLYFKIIKLAKDELHVTDLFLHAIPIITGVSYGFLQLSLVQELEFFSSIISVAYILILCQFLLCGAVASLLSYYLNLKQSLVAFSILPTISLVWSLDKSVLYANKYLVIAACTIYLILISLLFPKIIETLKEKNIYYVPNVLVNNMLGMSLGSFLYCYYFILNGRDKFFNVIFGFEVFCLVLVFVFFGLATKVARQVRS